MKIIKTNDFKLTKEEIKEFEKDQKKYDRHYYFKCLGCSKKYNNLGNDTIQSQYCSLVCKIEHFDDNEKLSKEKPKEWKKKLGLKDLDERFWNLKQKHQQELDKIIKKK